MKLIYPYISKKFLHDYTKNINMPKLELDLDYLCDARNSAEIEQNIKNRKGVGDINRVIALYNELKKQNDDKIKLMQEFICQASQIPNKSCPLICDYGNEPKVISASGTKRSFSFQPKEFSNLTNALRLMRTENLSNLAGHKSYYFMGQLAELEHALVQFTVNNLLARKFQLVSVPDILPAKVIENCGFKVYGERTQV